MNNKEYYKAYDKRYNQIHSKNMLWTTKDNTKEIKDIIEKYKINKKDNILDLGCGEGRDAIYLLNNGYNVTAIDYSINAINKCNELSDNKYKNKFMQFDILEDKMNSKYQFIYSIAVLHMFVLDEHRDKFLSFINEHLSKDGISFICIWGNGVSEHSSDINNAYQNQKRKILNNNEEVSIVTTSCRVVNFSNLEKELTKNGLIIKEKWISSNIPEFDKCMCVIVSRNNKTIKNKYNKVKINTT